MALPLSGGHVRAQEPSQAVEKAGVKREIAVQVPDLADIVPLASKMTGRLADLENRIKGERDIDEIVENCAEVEAELEEHTDHLERLNASKEYKYNRLVELREAVKQENRRLEAISKPVGQSIRQLETWRKAWQEEKKNWTEWQTVLQRDGDFERLQSTFDRVHQTIDRAVDLVLSRLNAMLTVQEKSGHLEERLRALDIELKALIEDERRSTLLSESPPMFSDRYIAQFRRGHLYANALKGLGEIAWPDSRFLVRQSWIFLLQGFISLIVIIAVYRNKAALNASKRWRFLCARPLSAGLFLGYMATVTIYEYQGIPAICRLAGIMVGGVAFARLMAALTEATWKKQFVYGLIIVLIATRLMDVLNFPLPLFRLYSFIAALAGLLFCLRLTGKIVARGDAKVYSWLLRSGSLFFAFVLLAELWGNKALASHLFTSLIHSVATVLVFLLFMHMIRGGLEWLFRTSPLRRAPVLHSDDTDIIIRRLSHFSDFVVLGLILLPALLMIWGFYDSLIGATRGLLALGFNLGSQRINVGLVMASAGIIYGSFLASWLFQKLLMDEMFFKRRVEKGVRLSVARLVHYGILIVGFLLALSALGFEITKITILLSALGVGIGFGLQGIVNNFVSGLILLFEQPVRVGDYIELDGNWAEIQRIGIRATTVQTFDQADLIVPNADLITNPVTNWTLTNRQVRVIIPVGVAYGSDVTLVMETLAACARDHEMVSSIRPPQVLFLSFGESSLDFELRVWVKDADHRLNVQSNLHQEIDRRFREANIEIAFPQQDLHLRSVDDSIVLQTAETV